MGERTICERQEDHSDMEMDISETGSIGMKGETRGTGMNGGVSVRATLKHHGGYTITWADRGENQSMNN